MVQPEGGESASADYTSIGGVVDAGYRFTAGDRVSVRFRAATLFSDAPSVPQMTPADLSLLSADL